MWNRCPAGRSLISSHPSPRQLVGPTHHIQPGSPYSWTAAVTSKGTVIQSWCSTAMSVNMLVQMREWPPTTPKTVLLKVLSKLVFEAKRNGTKGQNTHNELMLGVLKDLESISVFVVWNSERSPITYLAKACQLAPTSVASSGHKVLFENHAKELPQGQDQQLHWTAKPAVFPMISKSNSTQGWVLVLGTWFQDPPGFTVWYERDRYTDSLTTAFAHSFLLIYVFLLCF